MASGYINIPAFGSASWKDPVLAAVDLPTNGNAVGDARVVTSTETIYIWSGSAWVAVGGGGGGGTVTSVGLSAPASILSVSGSPVTTAGTLALSLINQTGNTVFASPANGSSGVPTFRALVPADIAVPLPTISQMVYVAQQGSDSSGNGTSQLPYATVTHAMVTITDAAANKLYGISVGPGDYAEPGILLKPFVYIIGSSLASTVLKTATATALHSSWNAVAGNSGMSTLTVAGAVPDLTLNFQSFTSPGLGTGTSMTFTGVSFVGSLTYKARGTLDSLRFFEGELGLNVNCSGGSLVFRNTESTNSFTVDNVGGGSEVDLDIHNCYVGNNFTVSTGATTCIGSITSSPVGNIQTFNGSGINLLIDATSIAAFGFLVLVGNPTLTFLDDAYGLGYTPVDATKWANPQPLTVQAALDRIAAVVGATIPIP